MNIKRIALYVVTALVGLSACNDPSVIGLDLVEDNQINIQSRKDIPFTLTTERGEAVKTYDDGFLGSVTTYLCGELNDPVFGVSRASIYAELGLNFANPVFNARNLTVDSIVLVLPYDQRAIYGDTTKEMTIEVYEILERMNNMQDYFSDETVAISDMPIGSRTFLPQPSTNQVALDYRSNREDTVRNTYLRIPLSNEFGQRFLQQDTLVYQSDSSFLQFFNGLHIRSSGMENTMLGFDLFSDENNTLNGGIFIYYDTLNTEGIPNQYQFPFIPVGGFSTVRFVNFKHDYTNTPVENNLGDKPANEEVVYVQGMSGVNGKLEFPDLQGLENIIVNQAKLELVVLPGNGEDPEEIFPPAEQLLLYKEGDNGDLELISDFLVASAAVGEPVRAFGGNLQPTKQDSTIQSYTINMSDHFQDIINGEAENVVYIQVAPVAQRNFIERQGATKAERANRSILGSERHPEEKFRAKFTLIYTVR